MLGNPYDLLTDATNLCAVVNDAKFESYLSTSSLAVSGNTRDARLWYAVHVSTSYLLNTPYYTHIIMNDLVFRHSHPEHK